MATKKGGTTARPTSIVKATPRPSVGQNINDRSHKSSLFETSRESWLEKSTAENALELSSHPDRENIIKSSIAEYNEVKTAITDRLGAALPPFDPYMLLALIDNNGYLKRANLWKVAATVGVGYKCSDRLRVHLKYANEHETFRQVLKKWALAIDEYGYSFVEIVKGVNTTNFYHMASVKTRVKPHVDGSLTYVHYEYGLGLIAWQELKEFAKGVDHGVAMFNLPSSRGHRFYGDPEWISAKKALALNVSIADVCAKFFENSMISDMAVVLKGAELDPQDRESIRSLLSNTFKGVDNAHKVFFIEVGPNEEVNFEKLNSEMNDAGYTNLKKENKEEIIAATGTPQRLVGVLQAGQLGGSGEVEGQIKVFKLGIVDPRQLDYTEYWQRLLDDAGLPDAETFELMPMRIDTAAADLPALTTAAGGPIMTTDEAREEWEQAKSAGATRLVKELADLRKELEVYDGE